MRIEGFGRNDRLPAPAAVSAMVNTLFSRFNRTLVGRWSQNLRTRQTEGACTMQVPCASTKDVTFAT
jgi:hypothetical protein